VNKIKISAVSYTNTKPFIYGLQHSNFLNKADLSLDIPSVCANKLIDNQADIGLVPVAALIRIPGYEIISNYCIGAVGAVNSVFIFSNKPVEEIKSLQMDPQSRTSNNLAKVLLKNYWKTNPKFTTEEDADAFVQIGDRTFGKKDQYLYVYDLAEEWQNFTGLPFVFAVWACNKTIPEDFIAEFNIALKYGLDHRKEVISTLLLRVDFDLNDYLMRRIDYDFNAKKQQALHMFLELLREV
jgi:chorismate dehydratase